MTNSMPNQFGEKIRKLREKKGARLRVVAASLDIDQSLLSKYERGERIPNDFFVKQIAKYFAFNEDELRALLLSDKFLADAGNISVAGRALRIAEQQLKYSLGKKGVKDE